MSTEAIFFEDYHPQIMVLPTKTNQITTVRGTLFSSDDNANEWLFNSNEKVSEEIRGEEKKPKMGLTKRNLELSPVTKIVMFNKYIRIQDWVKSISSECCYPHPFLYQI